MNKKTMRPATIIAGLVILSAIGVILIPLATNALIGTITINPIVRVSGSTYKATGTWSPQGGQCWTPGKGGTFHYKVQIYEDLNSNTTFDPGEELVTVTPAGCNEDYTSSVDSDNKKVGGNWPAIASATNNNISQPDATFTLGVGDHTICAALIHVNDNGKDIGQVSTCGETLVIFPEGQPYCGNDVLDQVEEECDTDASVACITDNGYVGVRSCKMKATGATQDYCIWNPCETQESCGDQIKNGDEKCDDTDGVGENQSCTDDCTLIEPLPVLSLDKLCTPNPVGAGENITYTLNWAIEETDASGVVLTDEIPANTSFVSASDPGVYDALTNTVMWNMGIVGPGNYLTTLVVKADSPLANGTVISNVANLTAVGFALDASCDVTASTGPILTIEKVVDETVVNPGQTINYTVRVTNSGTDTAYNVVMTDKLPVGFTSADDGTGEVVFVFGDMIAGESLAHTFAAVVGDDAEAGTHVNVVTVSSNNYTELEAQADLEVVIPQVLGEKIEVPQPQVLGESTELPVTGGSGILAVLSVIATVAGAGFVSHRQIRKQ